MTAKNRDHSGTLRSVIEYGLPFPLPLVCLLFYLDKTWSGQLTGWTQQASKVVGSGTKVRAEIDASVHGAQTTVCRYNWHSDGSPSWPFPVLKYKYIFQIKSRKQFYQTALG